MRQCTHCLVWRRELSTPSLSLPLSLREGVNKLWWKEQQWLLVSPTHTVQPTLALSPSLSAPSAPPSSVRVLVNSSTAISVQWGPVEPCADQNGPITGYSVRYGEMGSESTQNKTVSGENSRMATISELTKETVYTVEVAAETRAGTEVYSLPLTIQTPDSE